MSNSVCPQCGAPRDPNLAEPCSVCLLQLAALSDSKVLPESESIDLTIPDIEAVQKAFPQLEILELIGRGGMGTVFKARQPKLDRFVALKILSADLASKPTFAERFAREGKLLARLNHPNIVSVYDFGESSGFYFLLMEYVDGVNLRQAMREEKFSPDQALSIVPKICEALQYAHDEGVLHRDIKPENILLDKKSRVKIADFGIASVARWTAVGATAPLAKPAPDGRWSSSEDKLTQTGQLLGTPSYMAPEQLENPNTVDHRADIYSLGVVFYELLTGELPKGRFALPSEKTPVDANIDQIVLKALERERDKRQQSAEELKTEIETLSIPQRAGDAAQRNPRTSPPVFLLFSTLLLLIASVAATVWVPVSWMKNIIPAQQAQTILMQNQARALYWQQSEEMLRRFLDPTLFAKHLPKDFLAEYGDLFGKYQRRMLDRYETFWKQIPELEYNARANPALVTYQGISIRYPEEDNLITRWMKTPFKTRFYYVLWGLTLTAALSICCLYRMRQSEAKGLLFFTMFSAFLSSALLSVTPILYCWLGNATMGNSNFIADMDDFWGFFAVLGVIGYLTSTIMSYSILFTPGNKATFYRLRTLLALFLVLFPGLLCSAGFYLITQARIDLHVHRIYGIMQKEEMPILKALYKDFDADFQALLKERKIVLPFNVDRLMNSSEYQEQPLSSYIFLAIMIRSPGALISLGDLKTWNPPQQNMATPETMGGIFAWAMIFFFGVPGYLFAAIHLARLKGITERKGLISACLAVFFWPILFTVASFPIFVIAMIETPKSDDIYIFLFFGTIGVVVISGCMFFLRWYLRNDISNENVPL